MSALPREISFDPPIFSTTAREDVTIAFDMTDLLVYEQPPILPQTVLIRQDTHVAVPLQDPPVLNGMQVQQRLRGLQNGTVYRLYVSVETNTMRREGEIVVDVALD